MRIAGLLITVRFVAAEIVTLVIRSPDVSSSKVLEVPDLENFIEFSTQFQFINFCLFSIPPAT